jgi:uncharacterized protein
MESKKVGNTYIIRIDRGEELVAKLKEFCLKKKIKLGYISGVGATNKATIGLFDVETKKYHSKELKGNYEIIPLTGNISTMNGELYLHLHINLCDSHHKSFGGHLNSCIVSATFEGVIVALKGKIEREFNPEVGLNLYKF